MKSSVSNTRRHSKLREVNLTNKNFSDGKINRQNFQIFSKEKKKEKIERKEKFACNEKTSISHFSEISIDRRKKKRKIAVDQRINDAQSSGCCSLPPSVTYYAYLMWCTEHRRFIFEPWLKVRGDKIFRRSKTGSRL